MYKLQFRIYGIDGIIAEEGNKCREVGRAKFQTHLIKYTIPTDDLFEDQFFLLRIFRKRIRLFQ